jgi:hypothetical protein
MPNGQADADVGIVQQHRRTTQLAREPLSLAKYAVGNGAAKLPDRMPKAVKMPVSERDARRSAHRRTSRNGGNSHATGPQIAFLASNFYYIKDLHSST